MLAAIIVIGVVGLVLDKGLALLEARLLRWRPASTLAAGRSRVSAHRRARGPLAREHAVDARSSRASAATCAGARPAWRGAASPPGGIARALVLVDALIGLVNHTPAGRQARAGGHARRRTSSRDGELLRSCSRACGATCSALRLGSRRWASLFGALLGVSRRSRASARSDLSRGQAGGDVRLDPADVGLVRARASSPRSCSSRWRRSTRSWSTPSEGIESVAREHVEVARAFRFSRWQIVRKVILPSALPSIFAGCSSALIYAWLGTIGAEYLLAPGAGHRQPDDRAVASSFAMDKVLLG